MVISREGAVLAFDLRVVATTPENFGPVLGVMMRRKPWAMLDYPVTAMVYTLRYDPVHASAFAIKP